MDANEITQVFVDVSNVAAVRGTSGPEWDRIEAVIERTHATFPRATIFPIADFTLADAFRYKGHGHSDLALYEKAVAERRVTPVADGAEADDTILDQAARSATSAVVSNDFYVDKRREHPWIQGSTDRFYKVDCVTGSNGEMQVSLIPRPRDVIECSLGPSCIVDRRRGQSVDRDGGHTRSNAWNSLNVPGVCNHS